jgi:hypothetical protein
VAVFACYKYITSDMLLSSLGPMSAMPSARYSAARRTAAPTRAVIGRSATVVFGPATVRFDPRPTSMFFHSDLPLSALGLAESPLGFRPAPLKSALKSRSPQSGRRKTSAPYLCQSATVSQGNPATSPRPSGRRGYSGECTARDAGSTSEWELVRRPRW